MWTNVILISGKQGSGKSTLSKNLKELLQAGTWHPIQTRFAEPLYEMHDAVRRIVEKYGAERKEKDGLLLQLLGTEWGRKTLGENFWVECLQRRVTNMQDVFGRLKPVAIIDDCRFPNELHGFPGAFSVRLLCDRDARKDRAHGWRDTENHASETALDDCADFDLTIHTDLADPTVTARTVFDAWKNHVNP